MSTPGHHNDIILVGDVREVYMDETGSLIGVILLVDTEESCEVPVMFPASRPNVSVGDRLWVRGRLAFEPLPNRRDVLHFVKARWIDPVMRRKQRQ